MSPRRRAWTNFTSKNGLEIDYVKEATAVDGLGGALARKLRSESLRSQRQGRGAGSPRGMASPTMLCKPWRWTKWARSGSKTYVRSKPLGSQDRFVGHARREGRLHENHRCGREWRSLVWSGRRRSKTSRPLPQTEAGTTSAITVLPTHWRVAMNRGVIIIARAAGLSYLKPPADPVALPSFPAGFRVELLLGGPDGSVWVGTAGGGLALRKPGQDLQLIKERTGLPSMIVTALAPATLAGSSSELDPNESVGWHQRWGGCHPHGWPSPPGRAQAALGRYAHGPCRCARGCQRRFRTSSHTTSFLPAGSF